VPKDYTIKNGIDGLNERPVGTGPWKLVEWKRKDSMRLERWDGYWGAKAQARRLRFQVIPEAAARLAALRAGQVAVVDSVPPLDASVLARDGAIKVASSPQKLICRLYLNGRKEAFDSGGKDGLFADARVRQALALAINQDAIVKKLSTAMPSRTPAGLRCPRATRLRRPPYDRKQARRCSPRRAGRVLNGDGILNKNGDARAQLRFSKHHGQGFDETTPAVPEMLKAVGVKVDKPVDFAPCSRR
jgi:ABC-type transport system substrate-binding protein